MFLNSRQLALKTSANSFYGFLGVKDGGKLPLLQGAMSITGKGRQLIGEVTKYIEEKYHGKAVYGDSVAGHTPILVKHGNGMIEYVEIKDLLILDDSGIDKEHYNMNSTDIEIWTEAGWTRLISFMRHKTAKMMYRVITNTGVVDVTEDHSLLTYEGEEISPKDVHIGMSLLHSDLPNVEYINTTDLDTYAPIYTHVIYQNITEYYDGTTDVKEKFLIALFLGRNGVLGTYSQIVTAEIVYPYQL